MPGQVADLQVALRTSSLRWSIAVSSTFAQTQAFRILVAVLLYCSYSLHKLVTTLGVPVPWA